MGKIERPRCGPVSSVSTNQKFTIDPSAVNASTTFGGSGHDHSISKVSADTHCLLDEEVVESPPLGHGCQRLIPTPNERTTATDTQLQPIYDTLHHGLRIKRKLAHRSDGYTAPTGLVAWKFRLVEEQYTGSLARQTVSRGRTRRTSSDD
jgi:hypothetical protein